MHIEHDPSAIKIIRVSLKVVGVKDLKVSCIKQWKTDTLDLITLRYPNKVVSKIVKIAFKILE